MRVIGGSAGGVPLKGPPGPETRATSDKVRGAIFDSLAAEIVDARVLDLYAGTGALGIEALSRGAAACLFVEKASGACRVIEANLRATKLADRAIVWCMPVATALERLETSRWHSPSPTSGGDTRLTTHVPRGHASHGGWGVRAPTLDSTVLPPYNVIVLDPPYGDAAIVGVVERVGRSGLLARGGFVVLEHGKRLTPPPAPGALRLRRTRRYGDTAVTIWHHEEDADV